MQSMVYKGIFFCRSLTSASAAARAFSTITCLLHTHVSSASTAMPHSTPKISAGTVTWRRGRLGVTGASTPATGTSICTHWTLKATAETVTTKHGRVSLRTIFGSAVDRAFNSIYGSSPSYPNMSKILGMGTLFVYPCALHRPATRVQLKFSKVK